MIAAWCGRAAALEPLAGMRDGSAWLTRQETGRLETVLVASAPAEASVNGYRVGSAPLPHVTLERSAASGGLVIERGGFGGRPAWVRSSAGVVIASTDLSWIQEACNKLGWSLAIDAERAASLCLLDAGPAGRTQTLMREVREIPPATRAHLVPGHMRLEGLSPPAPRPDDTHAGRVERLRDLLAAAMDRAIDGASSVGVLTGGGLDSGALLAMAHARAPRTTAFAIDLDGDRPHLATLAGALDLTPSTASASETDLPTDPRPAGFPMTWPSGGLEALLLRRAREWGAHRVLAGLGADEHFDGHPEAASLLLREHGLLAALSAARSYDDASLRTGMTRALWPRLRHEMPQGIRRLLRQRRRPGFPSWAGPTARRVLLEAHERRLAEVPWVERTGEERIRAGFVDPHLARASSLRLQLERLSGVLRIDPYLDAELAAFMLGSSPEHLLGGGRRGLFREALAGLLPESLRTRRDKASFAPVHHTLFRPPLLARLEPHVGATRLADLGIVEPREFRRAFDETVTRAREGSGHLDARIHASLGVEAFLATW